MLHVMRTPLKYFQPRQKQTNLVGGTISISRQNNGSVCPVLLKSDYLHQRPLYRGPFFCHIAGLPLTQYQFSAIVKKITFVLRIENADIKSHLFRICMATTCAIEGMSDEQIKELGRWKSNAFLRYIRIQKGQGICMQDTIS